MSVATDYKKYMNAILKQPSAWIPVTLSLVVVTAWCIGLTTVGTPVREPDEGVGAHLFQMWLVLEVLMVAFFATKWLPRRPMQALFVLAIQIVAVLAGCAPVFYFKL